MSTKKIIILSIMIIVVIVIIIAALIILNRIEEYSGSDYIDTTFEEQGLYEANYEIELLDNKNKFYVIKKILLSIAGYFEQINGDAIYSTPTDNEEEVEIFKEEAIKAIDNILDNQYKEEINVDQNQIISIAKKYTNYDVIIDKIYVYDLSSNIDIYIINSYIGDKEFNILIKTDSMNETFSVFLEDYYQKYGYAKNMKLENIKISKDSIQENEYNVFQYRNVTDESMAEHYLQNYINIANNNLEMAYKLLDSEYASKRFSTFQTYKNYVSSILDQYSYIKLEKYSVTQYDDYTMYICQDQYTNKYIFKATNLMDYTVQLDTYTLQNEKINESYKSLSDKEKAMVDIDMFFQMINMQDYESAYNVLDDNFKSNYFNTLSEFETYIKQNIYQYNKVTYKQYSNKINSLHIYNIELSDITGKVEANIAVTVIIKLLDDMNFSLSFGATE